MVLANENKKFKLQCSFKPNYTNLKDCFLSKRFPQKHHKCTVYFLKNTWFMKTILTFFLKWIVSLDKAHIEPEYPAN